MPLLNGKEMERKLRELLSKTSEDSESEGNEEILDKSEEF